MYKLVRHYSTNEIHCVNKIDGNKMLSIPMVDGNSDYEEYLEWVAEGNTPEEAE